MAYTVNSSRFLIISGKTIIPCCTGYLASPDVHVALDLFPHTICLTCSPCVLPPVQVVACLYPMHSFVFLYNTCCHCFFLSIDPGLPVSHRHRHHYTVHKGIWYTTPLSMCFCGPFTIVSRNLSDALCHKFFLSLFFLQMSLLAFLNSPLHTIVYIRLAACHCPLCLMCLLSFPGLTALLMNFSG